MKFSNFIDYRNSAPTTSKSSQGSSTDRSARRRGPARTRDNSSRIHCDPLACYAPLRTPALASSPVGFASRGRQPYGLSAIKGGKPPSPPISLRSIGGGATVGYRSTLASSSRFALAPRFSGRPLTEPPTVLPRSNRYRGGFTPSTPKER